MEITRHWQRHHDRYNLGLDNSIYGQEIPPDIVLLQSTTMMFNAKATVLFYLILCSIECSTPIIIIL